MEKLNRIMQYLDIRHNESVNDFSIPMHIVEGYFSAMHVISGAMYRSTITE